MTTTAIRTKTPPTPAPAARPTIPQPALVWEWHKLFQEPVYAEGFEAVEEDEPDDE